MEQTRHSWKNKDAILTAAKEAVFKLDPRVQIRNPVMFVTEVGAILSTLTLIFGAQAITAFDVQIVIWLWFTVLFAGFAEAIAEGRGKAQAASLKASKTSTRARLLLDNKERGISADELKRGDIVICEAGDTIPSDGDIIEGIATVDESAITGESAPVIRESGGDRSAVTGGTRVLSDRILIKITAEPGQSFIDRMISLVEGAKRQKTPNEIALSIVLSGLTIVFLLAVMTLKPFTDFATVASGQTVNSTVSVPILVSLLVCLIPTTIGGLLSAIGISGMDRLIRRNVIAVSGRAIEAAGDIDVLLLDKTGTITFGNRMATAFLPLPGVDEKHLAKISQLASMADETAEGRSIVVLAKDRFALRAEALEHQSAHFVPFTAQTRMSGVDLPTPRKRVLRKGAVDSIRKLALSHGGATVPELEKLAERVSQAGGTPLGVLEADVDVNGGYRNVRVLGIIHLKDVVKGGIKERFQELRKMGIRTVMITGDNPVTAAAIAAEAGVDDFMAEATPEDKLKRIRKEQANGHLVAMTGDGTNDAPALAQADVGVAMNTGTQAAREAGNMVDLDSNPTKLIEIVEIGKQLLMTRGSLTTFSIANDVAKYFAILPAMFSSLYVVGNSAGPLSRLNLMELHSPQSAILSAVIFNALVIVALIPLALKGVRYQALGSSELLKRNLLLYGLGGLIAPFAGIKLIDVLIHALGWV